MSERSDCLAQAVCSPPTLFASLWQHLLFLQQWWRLAFSLRPPVLYIGTVLCTPFIVLLRAHGPPTTSTMHSYRTIEV